MIKELVPLRFVLILMIFFHHAAGFAGGGWSAVAYFFVLSGFCMMLGYRDRVVADSFSYITYIKKRFLKCYPLHWITLAVAVGLMIIQEHSYGSIKTLITNALLLQSWVPNKDIYFSYNAVSWYLSTALLAIALFPMLVTFLEKLTNKDRCLFGILILVAYIVVAFRMPANERHAMFYIHPFARLLDFILGMYLAYVYYWFNDNEKVIKWVKEHGVVMDVGFLISFGICVLIAIVVPSSVRSIAGLLWVPIAISLMCITLAQNSSTIFHKVLSSKITGVLTQCSFSLMMWHLIVIQQVSDTPPL